jgi:uncharacterized membrane protein YhaH (DUF805 family)
MSENPFAAPQFASDPAVLNTDQSYGGITRLPYFLITVVATSVGGVLVGISSDDPTQVENRARIVGLVIQLLIAFPRLKNLGYSGWWALGLFVPILNLLVGLRCLAAPEGYADHKTLDGPGKVIVGLFIGLIVMGVLIAIVLA